MKETLDASELSQQQTLTALHQVSKDHEKASNAVAEINTLLETATQEIHQTKALLQQSSNNLEEAEKELTRMKQQRRKLLMTEMLENKAIAAASEPKDLDDKSEEENQKLLKSNKALSRATSNLETLKRRVASLEDEK